MYKHTNDNKKKILSYLTYHLHCCYSTYEKKANLLRIKLCGVLKHMWNRNTELNQQILTIISFGYLSTYVFRYNITMVFVMYFKYSK